MSHLHPFTLHSPGPAAPEWLAGCRRGRKQQLCLRGFCCLPRKLRKQLEIQVPAQTGGRQYLSRQSWELWEADKSSRTAERSLTALRKSRLHSFGDKINSNTAIYSRGLAMMPICTYLFHIYSAGTFVLHSEPLCPLVTHR